MKSVNGFNITKNLEKIVVYEGVGDARSQSTNLKSAQTQATHTKHGYYIPAVDELFAKYGLGEIKTNDLDLIGEVFNVYNAVFPNGPTNYCCNVCGNIGVPSHTHKDCITSFLDIVYKGKTSVDMVVYQGVLPPVRQDLVTFRYGVDKAFNSEDVFQILCATSRGHEYDYGLRQLVVFMKIVFGS